MLTKKDIKKFTRATVTISGKVLKNREVYEHSIKDIRIILPKDYQYLFLNYPTKKDQNDFIIEDNQIICKKDHMQIIFTKD